MNLEGTTSSYPPSSDHRADRQSANVIGAFHRQLAMFNHERLQPRLPTLDPREHELQLRAEHRMQILERAFVEHERCDVHELATEAPPDARGFVEWFEALEQSGPGQHDPLFDWLAHEASIEDMTWFLRQEVAGEAGFDDLVALTQVKLATRAKLELARNYWDEMGCGHASAMHGPMLQRLAEELHIAPDDRAVVWQALALGNLLLGLASRREYTYQAIGALGVIELTAPGRAALVNAGLKRLGIGGEARRYFALHATLDVKHSSAWNREVIAPLVREQPDVAVAIAEGALMRLNAGARCFDRYRQALHVDACATSTEATELA